ncbi:MAG TPA: hypothetical protein VMP89_01540 [Solirubrobacteraceae bacterium]|nr:hypothetical protein [Solirubrobacteraceae bacterium]
MSARFRLAAPIAVLCALAVGARSGAPADAATGAVRTVSVTVSPGGGDLSLIAIRFPQARGMVPGARTVRVRREPAGYEAVAVPRGRAAHAQPVLVLVTNRFTRAEMPVKVRVTVRSAASLGRPVIRVRSHALGVPAARPAGVCSLTRGSVAVGAAALLPLSASGEPLEGFSTAGAVADAYNAVCGLPYSLAFRRAVSGTGAECAAGSSCEAAPEPAPAPSPGPEQPKCPPCNPKPGYACPLAASPAYCVAAKSEAAPSAEPAAH